MVKRFLRNVYWKIAGPLKSAILTDGSVVDLRDRLVHIEDWLAGDVRGRLVHIEDSLCEGGKTAGLPLPRAAGRYASASFAQMGEDAAVVKLFTHVLHIALPSYIDIGAHHPYEISNTALLYSMGCRGMNIEANPILFARFLEERPDDVNVNCGVSGLADSGKDMPFFMIDDWSGRNSFDKEMVENFIKDYPQFKIRDVRTIPMKSPQAIFDENNVAQCPDYMSMDIEGMEFDVLKDFDLKSNGPKVMTLEINRYSQKGGALKDLISDAGFFLWLKAGENYTYVKNEYKGLVYA